MKCEGSAILLALGIGWIPRPWTCHIHWRTWWTLASHLTPEIRFCSAWSYFIAPHLWRDFESAIIAYYLQYQLGHHVAFTVLQNHWLMPVTLNIAVLVALLNSLYFVQHLLKSARWCSNFESFCNCSFQTITLYRLLVDLYFNYALVSALQAQAPYANNCLRGRSNCGCWISVA